MAAMKACSLCKRCFVSRTTFNVRRQFATRTRSYETQLDYEKFVTSERLQQIKRSPSGWVPPAEPPPNLPFHIRRSRTNNLPVYSDIRGGGNQHLTIIRKIRGDLKELEACLKQRLGKDIDSQVNEFTSQIKLKGKHKNAVVRLLKELGF